MPWLVPQGDLFYLARNFLQGVKPAGAELIRSPVADAEIDQRLHSAFDWLKLAFQATGGKGFSKGFHYFSGWMPAYPETSGYIISSLLKYARVYQDEEARRMAWSAAEWLFTQHNPDGGIPAIGKIPGPSLAFDTGMVLHGYMDLYHLTHDQRVAEAARRCADYLCRSQNADGSWTNCYQGIPHAYHARVSWPVLDYARTFHDGQALQTAERNLEWVVSQQRESGYWEQAFFTRRRPYANTHSLGYILEGLIESYLFSGKTEWLASAKKAADCLLNLAVPEKGYLPGYMNSEWQEVKIMPFAFACLTGITQISRSWLLLEHINGEGKYLEAAEIGLSYVSQFQDIAITLPGIRGALPGSAPIIGGYLPFQYPNWAVKFFMDLLLERKSRNIY
ncbi:MAG: hypothetical protein AB9891_16065 [Anaerolineaceae bacterium]